MTTYDQALSVQKIAEALVGCRLGARTRHLEHVGPCALCGDRAQDLRDLLEEEGWTES